MAAMWEMNVLREETFMDIAKMLGTGSDVMALYREITGQAGAGVDTGFANFFANALKSNNSASAATQPAASAFSLPTGPAIPSTQVDSKEAYEAFRDNVLNGGITLPDEMLTWYTNDDGERHQGPTGEGHALLAQTRVDNLKPIAPGSYEEAVKKAAAASKNLECYVTKLMAQNGVKGGTTIQMLTGTDGTPFISGLFSANVREAGATDREFRKYSEMIRDTPAGDDYKVMGEEAALYMGIAKLGEQNPEFRRKYNANPEAAMDEYYLELSDMMANNSVGSARTVEPEPLQFVRAANWNLS